ncbi:MAG: hypothetical protein ACRDG3_11910 [Tepidiformaceae bacterium]
MKQFIFSRPALGAILVAIVSAAIAGAACGSGSSSKADATTTNSTTAAAVATIDPSISNAAAISAINILDNAGLHDFDTSIAAGTVPPTAQTTAEHLQATLLLTPWPDDSTIKADAQALAAKLGLMASLLNTDTPDMARAGAAAHDAHESEHAFSSAVWTYLETKAGVKDNAVGTPTSE